MTALLIWKALAGLLATPAMLVVARAAAKRLGRIPKEKASEVDYLRDECKREREDAAMEIRAIRAECAAEMLDRDHELVRLRHVIDALKNEVEGLQGALAECRHDLKTAARFVDSAITTRRDKR